MNNLPKEILIDIFSFVPYKEVIHNLSLVSTDFSKIIDGDVGFWKTMCTTYIGGAVDVEKLFLDYGDDEKSEMIKKSWNKWKKIFVKETGNLELSIIVMGYSNSGKSTLCGHLLTMFGDVNSSELKAIERVSKEQGKETMKYAWLMDRLKAERERGITIDISTKSFKLPASLNITLVDAPGLRDFDRNTMMGLAQSDVSLLVVDCRKGEFEENKESYQRYGEMAYHLGVTQMIVAMNKMDCFDFKEERYDEVHKVMSEALSEVGFDTKLIPFVPISAWTGENLNSPSKIDWWNEQKGLCGGMSLIQSFNSAYKRPKRYPDHQLRMPIGDVYKIGGIGIVLTGRIAYGTLRKGMKVYFAESKSVGTVKSIEVGSGGSRRSVDVALPGYFVGFNVEGITIKNVRRGYVCVPYLGEEGDAQKQVVREFTAQVTILNHPGRIRRGYTPVITCHTCSIACKFNEFSDGRIEMRKGDTAEVKFWPVKKMVVEKFEEFERLGRFLIRDMRQVVGYGIIKEVTRLV